MSKGSTTTTTTAKRKPRSRKKAGSTPRAPKKNSKKKRTDPERDGEMPVSAEVVTAPPLDPHPPMPEGYEVGDRVVIQDMGSRHGEIEEVDEDQGLLLVRLDGTIIHPQDPTVKVNRIEIEQSRCRVCRGSRE